MATPVVRFEPRLLPEVRRFAERVWRRPRSEAFYRWRYLDPPLLRGWLAMYDGDVVAAVWAFRRPWRVGERTLHFLEVFDWYALPELRNSGVGVRAIQAVMDEPDPCVLVGGTEDNLKLMPRLGIPRVAEAARFVLPLRGARLAPLLARRARLPGALARPVSAAVARAWFWPRRRSLPGGRAFPVATLGEEALRLLEDASACTRPLWPPEHLRWIASGFAGSGLIVPLYFERAEALVGFALLRIHAAEQGCDGQLVELVAREPDGGLHAWMISEVAATAAGLGAGLLSALTTCPVAADALRANRFLPVGTAGVHVHSRDGLELAGPLHLGHNTSDGPLIPSVTSWP